MFYRNLIPIAAILLLGTVLSHGTVFAADETVDYTQFSLDDLMEMSVVSGASKYIQKTSEAPSSISIITAEEIHTFGWRSLWEVLDSLHGFSTTYDRDYHYIGVRGVGYPGDLSNRLLVLVDGIRVNETALGGVLTGRGFIVDLDLVSRVEVIRGPASSLYGTNAMVGIVNIVTREGYQLQGAEVKTGYSSFGTLEGRVTYGNETESGIDYLFSATKGNMKGQDFYFEEFDDPSTNNGKVTGLDREEWDQFYAKVLYDNFTLEGMYSWRYKGYPLAGLGTMFNDDRAASVDIQQAYAATYKAELPHRFDMAVRAYYQNFKSEIRYPYDYVYDWSEADTNWVVIDLPEGLIYQSDSWGQRLTTELDFTRSLSGGHMLAFGAEYRNTFRQDNKSYDHEPYYRVYGDQELDPTNYSAYALADLQVLDNLRLNLGLRHDHYKSFVSSTNPRLALVAEPFAGSVFKATYGKAFRAPVGYDLSDEQIEQEGVDLSPNEIETFEIIWEQKLPYGLRSSISAYDWDYQDIPQDVDPDNISDYFLDHEAIRSKGVEVELAGRSSSGVSGRASWSYNDVEVPESELTPGRGEPRGPRHMVKANVMVPLRGKESRLGLELRHVSKRLTVRREWTDAYTLVNLSLSDTRLMGGPEIRASVMNLFDADNGHPGTWGEQQQVIWQDGRSYRLYLTVSR